MGGFSVVSLFNVLDECVSLGRLLAAAHELLAEDRPSWLLLATPLPFIASYFGWRTRWSGRVIDKLGLSSEGMETADWEGQALELLERILPQYGFEPRAVSRVPYLSGGDALEPGCLELDDFEIGRAHV